MISTPNVDAAYRCFDFDPTIGLSQPASEIRAQLYGKLNLNRDTRAPRQRMAVYPGSADGAARDRPATRTDCYLPARYR